MADDSIPAARFSLPAFSISQSPFLQSWNGIPSPFANQQDQIQQSMQISGVYPGQMPDNTFLGNTAARYAFGRTLPGSSPYQGALTSYMQGKGMPTGIPLGILGLQGGIGQPPPPNSSGPPYPGGGTPGTYPPPGGGGFGAPPPGNPAPPPFPGPSGGGTPPPSGGGGLLGGDRAAKQAFMSMTPAQQQAIRAQRQQQITAAMPSDINGKVMYSIANGLPWTSTGLTADQYNQAYYALPSDWDRAAYRAR